MQKFITKHTPGEWIREGRFIYALYSPSGKPERNRFQCHVTPDYSRESECTEQEAEATATIMWASPLLLSALIKAVEDHDLRVGITTSMREQGHTWKEWPEIPSWYHEAKAAIAAAGVVVEESKEEASEK